MPGDTAGAEDSEGRARLLHGLDCEGIKTQGYLCWGCLRGGTSSGSFCVPAWWIGCFLGQNFWDSAMGNVVWQGVWGVPVAGGDPSGHWSCPLWRGFGLSSGSLQHWECDRQGASWTVRLGSFLNNLASWMKEKQPKSSSVRILWHKAVTNLR